MKIFFQNCGMDFQISSFQYNLQDLELQLSRMEEDIVIANAMKTQLTTFQEMEKENRKLVKDNEYLRYTHHSFEHKCCIYDVLSTSRGSSHCVASMHTKMILHILKEALSHLSLIVRKPVFGVSDLVRHKSGCTVLEDG